MSPYVTHGGQSMLLIYTGARVSAREEPAGAHGCPRDGPFPSHSQEGGQQSPNKVGQTPIHSPNIIALPDSTL